MKRKEFLQNMGLAGLGITLAPQLRAQANAPFIPPQSTCTLIPSETAGPFPLDLTANSTFFRQDVREGNPGVQLNQKLRIIGADNCLPMQNVRVNIWHCDNEGVYSGYNTGNNPGDVNDTQFRGYQFTDANGEVEFITILPGWYNGRICHIHFQVYVSSSYAAVSQLTFPVDTKNAIYAANSSLYPKGADPLSIGADNIFSDGHSDQLATLTPNSTTGGYDSFLEVTVQGSGTSGVGHLERQTASVAEVGQNFPNPYTERTAIPLNLKQPAQVDIELWDLNGKRVYQKNYGRMNIGTYTIDLELGQWGLEATNYVYQVVLKTDAGTYRIPKVMTAIQ